MLFAVRFAFGLVLTAFVFAGVDDRINRVFIVVVPFEFLQCRPAKVGVLAIRILALERPSVRLAVLVQITRSGEDFGAVRTVVGAGSKTACLRIREG